MGVYWIHPDVCPSIHPSVCRQGFPELFEKIIGSIHFIPGIYPYGMSFLTPIHFSVPSLIFGPLVTKYLAENGVSGTFWRNYWPNSFHTWHLPLWGEVNWPLYIFVFLASFFRPSGGQIFVANSWHFPIFLHKLLRYLKYHDTLVGKMMP